MLLHTWRAALAWLVKDEMKKRPPSPPSSPGAAKRSAPAPPGEELYPAPVHLDEWIRANEASLVPPVCNKMVYADERHYWKVMVIGGPNVRTDYHVEEGEELFLQLRGQMTLKTVDGGVFTDVPVGEGELFLLPGRVPHSPQRGADTVGLVIERRRKEEAGERDGLRWYCGACRAVTFETTFFCHDLGSQLGPVIGGYYADAARRTCPECGTVDEPPPKGAPMRQNHGLEAHDLKNGTLPRRARATHPDARPLDGLLARGAGPVDGAEFKVAYETGPAGRGAGEEDDEEVFFFQQRGSATVHTDAADVHLPQGCVYLLPPKTRFSVSRPEGSRGFVLRA